MKLKNRILSLITAGLIVFCISGCGDGASSSDSKSITPDVPSVVSATQGSLPDSIVIDWDAVENAEYYVIYKAIDNPENFKVIATRVLDLTYSDPASSNRICYYRIAAGNGTRWSDPSEPVRGFALKGAPMPPENVADPESTIGQITLSWDPVLNAVSYNIYRADVKYGEYVKINSDPVTGTTYADSNVVPDDRYYYKIVAVNADGEGAASDVISGSALQQMPVWPASLNLKASDGEFGEKVKIEWAAAEYAASYTIYRGASSGTCSVIAEKITGLVYEDRDISIEDNTAYYYTVAAISSGGSTLCGAEDTGYVNRALPPQIAPPVTVRASKGKSNVITVTWSEVTDSIGYSVYRSASSDFTTFVAVVDKTTGASFDDVMNPKVSDRTTYYYKVSAWSRGGAPGYLEVQSEMSAIQAEGYANPDIPGTPVNITSSIDYTERTVTLSWAAKDAWTKRYTVYRSDNGIDGDYNAVSENQTPASIAETLSEDGGTIDAGVVYYYKVKAVNDVGESILSDAVSALFILYAPGNFAVTKLQDNMSAARIGLSWNAVAGASSYKIQRRVKPLAGSWGDWSDLTTVTNLTYEDGGLAGTRYYDYRVQAINESAASEWSDSDEIYMVW